MARWLRIFSKLRIRILLLILFPILVMLGFEIQYFYYNSKSEITKLASNSEKVAKFFSQHEETIADTTFLLLDSLLDRQELITGNIDQARALLARILQTYPGYLNFYMTDAQGRVLYTAIPGNAPQEFRTQPYFNQILQTKMPAIGDIVRDSSNGKASLIFGVPDTDPRGKVNKILFALINVNDFNLFESNVSDLLPKGSSLALIDMDNRIVMRIPYSTLFRGSQLPENFIFPDIASNSQGIIRKTIFDGEPWIFAYYHYQSSVFNNNLRILLEIPENIAFADIRSQFWGHVVVLLVLFIVISLFAYFLMNPMLMIQIHELVYAAREYTKGNYAIRVEKSKYATFEIKELIVAFNAMVDGIQERKRELVESYDTTLEGWVNMLDLKDNETQGHSKRVTELSVQFARLAGVSEEQLPNIRRGALLHDIGKIGVPDSILNKAGPLTEEEWVVMRRHPEAAYEILSKIKFLQPAADIPYCHHEKWDGSGYPRRLKGEEIPLGARLFAIVDVWDALNSNRPYRKAWPREKAFEYIRQEAGKHFDPHLVEIFVNMIQRQSAENA